MIGTGFVGVVSSAVFSSFGNTVYGLDVVEEKIEKLKRAEIPFYEPGLKELVEEQIKKGNLHFTTSYQEAISGSDVVILAVGTPSAADGQADLKFVFAACETLAPFLKEGAIVAIKSTVPPGTNAKVEQIIREKTHVKFFTASLPEFLKEGTAVQDTLHPDRILIGATDASVIEKLKTLHASLGAPVLVMKPESAQMAKYAANAYLATRITFINQIANLCEINGADVLEVIQAIGQDKRIGGHYWYPGLGYGGSCFKGNETVFMLNSPRVAPRRLDEIFQKANESTSIGRVEVREAKDARVLAFDLHTGNPTIADVHAITRRPYQGDMVKITTSMGRLLHITSDHPVVLRAENTFIITPASHVSEGDQVMALMELPKTERTTELNLIELLRGTKLEKTVYVSSIDASFEQQYPIFVHHIPKNMLHYPLEIKKHNRMSLTLFRYLEERGVLHISSKKLQVYTAKGAATKINAVISIDQDFMRLCGYYLAEGYIGLDVGRVGALRSRIGFCFSEREYEYISDTCGILKRLGMKYIQRHATHAITTIVSSRVFAWVFRDVLKMGVRSEDKSLPRIAFNVPEELRFELVRGMFSGDGAVTKVQKGRNMFFEYATVSKSLADGAAFLLQTLGIVSSIRVRMMNKSKHQAYILRINGYQQMKQLMNVFGEKRRDQIQTILAGYQKHIKQSGFTRCGPYTLLRVQKIEREKVDTFVYSLETSTGTLIGSSGLIEHNCFPKDVKELAAYAKGIGQNGNLMVKVSELNEERPLALLERYEKQIGGWEGKTVGILGLSFKPNTDDMREAPSTKVIPYLLTKNTHMKAYDPLATKTAQSWFPQWNIEYTQSTQEALKDSDIVMLLIECEEFISLSVSDIAAGMKKGGWFIDVRDQFASKRKEFDQYGIHYIGVGIS